jgi:uncharacterized protein YeaO (DUF488 family)
MAEDGTVAAHSVRIARAYDQPEPGEGVRVLVDRLWPRGVAKAGAPWDRWCREVAPSDELRRWYGHDPELFGEFAERYRAELADPARAAAVQELRALHAAGPVVLVTATKDVEHSQAAVLVAVLAAA